MPENGPSMLTPVPSRPSRRALVALLTVLAVTGTTGQQSTPQPRAWPPGLQSAPPTSPPLLPDEARRTFHLAPGYRIELVASEPLVQDPVAIDWDPQGRLWVVEMPGYMPDIAATGEHDPIGRVVVLQDVDGDGRMDRRTVFADGLVLARSLKVLEHGVLVGEPPNIWLMRDTTGDLRADQKTLVTDRFGHRDIDVQNNANGFDWGPDNRLRTAGQSRIHLQWTPQGRWAVGASPTRGQWGVSHDDAGRMYRNSNESALHVDLVDGEYFARNPSLLRTRGSYERLATDENHLHTVWPVRPTPGLNRGYQAGIRRADGTLERYTAACSPLVFRGDRLPAETYGNVFVADPAANLVSRITLREDGAHVRAARAYPDAEFLASTDERFRPVFLANAPDGTLHVVDMYRGLIEHRLSLTEYLKEYAERRGLVDPRGLGRIWRVVHEGLPRDTSPLATTRARDLVAALAHPNGWRRDAAQRVLVERGDASVAPALEALARTAPDARTRVHALWTLDGLEAIAPEAVRAALRDTSPLVRRAAVKIAERWLGEHGHPIAGDVAERAADDAPGVRVQAAASLGTLPDGQARWDTLARLIAAHGEGDPVVVDVVLSGSRGAESRVLERLISGDTRTPPTGARMRDAVTLVAATVFHAARDAEALHWLGRIGDDTTPMWLREALMHGAEIGVLGAPTPGLLPPLVNPALTCPTCPGGRLSQGGAYAYGGPATATRTGPVGPALRLTRAPQAFVTLAVHDTQLGRQAAAVLTRVTWPGKPGDADAPPPLTGTEQQRFDAGRRVYESLCQACHQADGRGLPGRAASLVGSPLALGEADVPVRILLHGKEGATGLMPGIGATLDDETVASVLTYVRREWGHGASPVDAATVSHVRAQDRGRTRPWTDAELLAVR
jgi:putative membrane-bound dehydrogenase-like protein